MFFLAKCCCFKENRYPGPKGENTCFCKGIWADIFIRQAVLLCLLMLCLFLSCEKPPVDRIIRAEKALQEAHNIKARLYAADSYEKADKALTQARYFVKIKKYREAVESADLAILYARQSIDLVSARERKIREPDDGSARRNGRETWRVQTNH